MINEPIILTTEVSFKDFLFKNKRNRTILWLAASVIIIQFSAFKFFYPFASYIHGDSFSYLDAAYKNSGINTYLVGYSKFLRLISIFTKSDLALTSIQFLLIHCSILFLLFTLFYFYKPSIIGQNIILCFMIFNPLFWHLANLISSDGYFLSLSILWFSTLLWLIHRPTTIVIIWHAFILYLAFLTRYNAMLYPFLSLAVIGISKIKIKQKTLGFVLVVFLCGSSIISTCFQYKRLTGSWQYSPFSGWQMINNAMYSYRFVDSADRKNVPSKFKELDIMIRQYFDSTRDLKKHPLEALLASTLYMWDPRLTLYKYRDSLFIKDKKASEFKKWASIGPFYKSYGTYIIMHYPKEFGQYFLWPNARKYYAPPVEFLQIYNSGSSYVTKETQRWFSYKSQKVKTRFANKEVWILNFYPILSGVINAIMFCSLICYLLLKKWQFNKNLNAFFALGTLFWLLNAGFTIFASSAALRFQSFPIIITTTLCVVFIDWMIQLKSINMSVDQAAANNNNSNIIFRHEII